MKVNSMRAGAYALLAMGLINMVYQSGKSGMQAKSLLISAFGAITLLLLPKFKANFESNSTIRNLWWATAALFTIAAFLI